MPEVKVNSGIRLVAMFLDHIVMTFIAMAFFIPAMIPIFIQAMKVNHDEPEMPAFGKMMYFATIGFALYFCKDCINGRSPAKRILKLQVVNDTTGQPASPLRCFVRDLFIIIWPLEAIVALINPSRRIGDLVAGTKLVPFDPLVPQPKPNYGQAAVALGISYGILLLIMIPINALQSKFAKEQVHFVKSSFNMQESLATTILLDDSLGNALTANVKVYDKVEHDSIIYVSTILRIKNTDLENNFESLKLPVIHLLQQEFAEKPFLARLKFVAVTNGGFQIQTTEFDSRTMK